MYKFLLRSYPKSLMHCYEVIPEGRVCKLYFDLEFHKPSNPEADGEAMVTSLIQVQSCQLASHKENQPQLELLAAALAINWMHQVNNLWMFFIGSMFVTN